MANEAKAILDFMIVLFVAFMSPSRLVFAYSIAEALEMGKHISSNFPAPVLAHDAPSLIYPPVALSDSDASARHGW
jgi:hypothetical protein